MIEIIPAIDIIEGRCVRLSQGDYATRKTYDQDPAEWARRYADCGVRRLHLVDLEGAKAARRSGRSGTPVRTGPSSAASRPRSRP